MRIALVLIVAGAAGLVGGLAAAYLKPPAATEAAPPRAGDTERIRDLEAALARMEERVRTLEIAPPLAAAAPRSGTPEVALGGPGASAATPAGDGSSVAGPELDERIREVIAEKERVQREEQRKRFDEMFAEREKQFEQRLGTDFGLTPYQTEQVMAILRKRREAFTELRDRLFVEGSGPDPARRETMRTEFQKLRDDADKELQTVLTPEQYEAVQPAITAQYGPGWMGGPGMGGPPPGR
jgi:hypothetical protein